MFKKILYFVFLVIVAFVAGCSAKFQKDLKCDFVGCEDMKSEYKLFQTDKPLKKSKTTAASIEYRILPQDRLKIILYKDPAVSAELGQPMGEVINPDGVLVDAKGYVYLPLIGRVKVAWLTQPQATKKIEKLYKKYLTEPSVYLEVMNKRIVVLGEVNKPGIVKLDKEKMSLLEALGFAGGLTDDAVRTEILVLSKGYKGKLKMRKVDLTDFHSLTLAKMMLRPNDVVYVQPNEWKEFKVKYGNYTFPFSIIAKVLSPFVTLKILSN